MKLKKQKSTAREKNLPIHGFRVSHLVSGSAVFNSMGRISQPWCRNDSCRLWCLTAGLLKRATKGLALPPFMEAVSSYLISLQASNAGYKLPVKAECNKVAFDEMLKVPSLCLLASIRKVKNPQSQKLRTAGEQRRPEHHTKYNGRTGKTDDSYLFHVLDC